jgi:uncharacterized protein with FMN-binding domain
MKKKIIVALVIICSILVFTGCTSKSNKNDILTDDIIDQNAEEEISVGKYNSLIELSLRFIRHAKNGDITDELIEEMVLAGFNEEEIDELKTQDVNSSSLYNDGVYTGIGEAHNGKIILEVTIFEGRILFIEVIDHEETAPELPDVFTDIPKAILKNQTTNDVDAVSGASDASEGYIFAVNDALIKAKK